MLKNPKSNPREIQSVQRAISILNCFDSRNTELSLGDISNMLDLNKSTIYGILYTLFKYGYIDKNPKNGRYCLGAELLRKSMLVSSAQNNSLEMNAIKYLRRLTTAHSVTSYLFSYQNGSLSCLEMLIPSNSSYGTVSTVLGKKMAYHAAASGKVVMAHFTKTQLQKHLEQGPFFAFTEYTVTDPEEILREAEEIQRNGYALEREEVDIGVGAISVPILNPEGSLIGTISISTTIEWLEEIRERVVYDLLEYSRLVTDAMFSE